MFFTNQIYILEYPNGDKIEAQVDTCYETDNGLEMEDPDYEEYHACAMRIVKVIEDKNGSFKEGSLIEINYHNYPQQIYKRRSMWAGFYYKKQGQLFIIMYYVNQRKI